MLLRMSMGLAARRMRTDRGRSSTGRLPQRPKQLAHVPGLGPGRQPDHDASGERDLHHHSPWPRWRPHDPTHVRPG